MRKTVKISLGILSAVAIAALVGMKFMPGNEETKVAEETKAAIEKEIETKNEKELTPEELKAALDKIEIAEKPSEISHPKKEEVKEKPEDMVTVVPVKTTGQPIATSKKEPVKKEDDSKKVDTVVKPVVTEKKPTETTETKKTDSPKSKPTETKPKETSKPSIDDYRGELPDYGGDGPTPASELGDGTGGGNGFDFDELNKNN